MSDPNDHTFALRLATPTDVPAISALIACSVMQLMGEDYTDAENAAALGHVYGVDHGLIEDRTYFVCESGGAMAGCGGWSFRDTLFGAHGAEESRGARLDPAIDPARIRAFFVDPAFVRRGVGSAILQACEDAAREAGFKRAVMGATYTGVRLYAARGYREIDRLQAAIPGGSVGFVHMSKPLI